MKKEIDYEEMLALMAETEYAPLPDGFHESVMDRVALEQGRKRRFRVPLWAANTAAAIVLAVVFVVLGLDYWGAMKSEAPLEEAAMSTAEVAMEQETAEDQTMMSMAVPEEAEEPAAGARMVPEEEMAEETTEGPAKADSKSDGLWQKSLLVLAGLGAAGLLAVNLARRRPHH